MPFDYPTRKLYSLHSCSEQGPEEDLHGQPWRQRLHAHQGWEGRPPLRGADALLQHTLPDGSCAFHHGGHVHIRQVICLPRFFICGRMVLSRHLHLRGDEGVDSSGFWLANSKSMVVSCARIKRWSPRKWLRRHTDYLCGHLPLGKHQIHKYRAVCLRNCRNWKLENSLRKNESSQWFWFFSRASKAIFSLS